MLGLGHRSWLRRFALASTVVATLALPSAASGAEGTSRTVWEYTADNPTIDLNPCTGEQQLLLGRLMLLYNMVVDANGTTHVHGINVFQNFTATGLETGVVYRFVQVSPFTVETTVGADVSTVQGVFRLVGPGGTAFVFRVLEHFTLTPDGELVASVEFFSQECS